ncbi:MAG: non-ribosomal peptide synthetase [Chloroflexi bacterium]|nr:non-ribosomal peptide synthetase [Chloroflexota bacterium]
MSAADGRAVDRWAEENELSSSNPFNPLPESVDSSLPAAATALRSTSFLRAGGGTLAQENPSFALGTEYGETRPIGTTDEGPNPLPQVRCLHHLIELHARRSPASIAVLAPGRSPLTYGQLQQQMVETVETLNRMGYGRGDRLAVVLPNGPEMAVAYLAVAAGMACAPLNPASTVGEYEHALSNLRLSGVLVHSGLDSPVRDVARARGIPVVELSPQFEAPAGRFQLDGEERAPAANGGLAGPGEIAVVLQTSGTTGHAKIVPRTHQNLSAAMRGSLAVLPLSPGDRCLCIMPLFHASALDSAVGLSVASGGSVVCTPGLSVPAFFEWLEEFRPTWYLGSPTMHQAILGQAEQHRGTIQRCPLRFIRSGTAPLSVQLLAEIERTFGAPVIEGYGMTEALRITLNPLQPEKRKVGSVGIPASSEVAIVDEAGRFLARRHVGEITVRGANVFGGYENDPEATGQVLVDGWFRTGDQGYLDEDGYLFVTGRLKEVINRGGQKVSPREVDDVLRQHPAVAEAVAFAVPHASLGEDVAAAVVLRENADARAEDLRMFAAQRLSSFKLPRQIVILDAIPKGPTGKVQRIGLAEKLGLVVQDLTSTERSNNRAVSEMSGGTTNGNIPAAWTGSQAQGAHLDGTPQDGLERQLAAIWEAVLGVRPIGARDDFFALGGHSLHAVQLFAEIERVLGRSLPPATLLQAPTIAQLADLLRQTGSVAAPSSLVVIRPGGSKPPLFWVHALGGHVLCYRNLARYLDPDQPVYALQARGLDGRQPPDASVEAMASAYIEEVRAIAPAGPCFLGGLSLGGTIAFEMAHRLHDQGRPVALLALLDTYAPGYAGSISRAPWPQSAAYRWRQSFDFHRGNLATRGFMHPAMHRWSYARDRLKTLLRQIGTAGRSLTSPEGSLWLGALRAAQTAHRIASDGYVPRIYPGGVTLFRASNQPMGDRADPTLGWDRFAAGGVDVYEVPGYHASVIVEPNVRVLGNHLRARLGAALHQVGSPTTSG